MHRPSGSRHAPRVSLVALLWVASLLLLAAAGWAGVRYRQEIMRAWPPSVRLYLALGLRK